MGGDWRRRSRPEAAISISRYLKGEDMAAGRSKLEMPQENFAPIPADIEKQDRAHQAVISMAQRKNGFAEVEQGITEEQARAEASKCLNCMTCCECRMCARRVSPPRSTTICARDQ